MNHIARPVATAMKIIAAIAVPTIAPVENPDEPDELDVDVAEAPVCVLVVPVA